MAPNGRLAPLLVLLAAAALPLAEGFARAEQGGAPPPATANDMDRLLARADSEEQGLKAELADIGPKLDITRRRMVARGRAYYRTVRAGLLPAGGGFDALVDHAARVARMRYALERDIAGEAALVKRSSDIEARILRLRAERAPMEVQREAMNRARMALQENDERRAAFSRAFETSVRPDAVAIYGADTGPDDGDKRTGFRSMKGRLPFPIAGRAEVHRVNRASANGPGVELTAPVGTAVRSVAAGRVVFADRNDDYGLTVIIDHGEHYYTVYGNLGSSDLHNGDTVAASSRVGVVGSANGHAPALYFELRQGATTIDPGPWLGL